MDIAQLGYEIDSSQARTAARDLDKMNAAAQKAEKGARSLKAASENLLRDEKGRFMTTAQAAEKYGDEIDRLRTKYNPLYAASKQYEASMSELKRALELGAISTAQFDAAQDRLQQSLLSTGSAMQTMGTNIGAATSHATNMLFQFQDIGMMLAAGQNPLMLAMQQGTQIAGIFEQMKGSGQSAGSVIKSAFLGLISPTSLLTVGVIAGGAALVQWGMSALGAAQNGKTFEENLDDIDARVTELKTSLDLLATDNYQGVIDQYGRVNDQIRENILIVGQLNANLLALQSINLDNLFSDTLGSYLKIRIDELKASFEMTYDEAQKLDYLMRSADAAQGIDEKIRLMTQVRDQVILAAGGVDKLNTKQSEFLLGVANAIAKLEIAKSRLDAMADVNVSGPISTAANEASRLARNLSSALAVQQQLEASNNSGAGYAPDLNRFSTVSPFTGSGSGMTSSPRPVAAPVGVAGVDWGYAPENGAGGGGGGRSDQYQSNLQSLIESLQTEQETVDAWYQSSLAILNDRRASEILSTQEHNDLKLALEREYQEKLAGIRDSADQYGLASASEFFGDLYSLSGSKYDGLLKMQKTFAAASALVNTYLAASQTLADPTLSFWMKFAAVAKVIAAGMGLVNAIKGGGTSGGGASSGGASTSATAATKAEPERVTRVVLQGDDWLVNMAESIMTQIYDASSNGRVIVSRG